MPSTALAGYIGYPTTIEVPPRSMKRIQNAMFDADGRHSSIDRTISFQAIKTQPGDNITQVTIESRSVDGHPVGEVICIVYRNSRFKCATSEVGGRAAAELTLTAALNRIRTPVGINA